MNKQYLKVAEWKKAPGPRLREEGKNSGEEFREDILFPRLKISFDNNIPLKIVLDGTYGYTCGFLEEAFGGLVRKNNVAIELIFLFIEFVSEEDSSLIHEIKQYIYDASEEKSKAKS